MNKGILRGYYGYGNFGDDLFLYFLTKHLISRLKQYFFIIPIRHPDLIPNKVYLNDTNFLLKPFRYDTKGRRLLSKAGFILEHLKAEIYLYGGGTFLYEKTGIKNMKANLVFLNAFLSKKNKGAYGLGIGIDKINQKEMITISKEILNKFTYIIFRDKHSLQNAAEIVGESIYKKSTILPDLAYGLYKEVNSIAGLTEQTSGKLGINFMVPFEAERSNYIYHMSRLVSDLAEKFDIYAIVAQNTRYSAERSLIQEIVPNFAPDKIISYNGDIMDFFRKLSTLEIIVGSKLHVLVAAHLLGKPFLNIRYQEKTRYFMEEIGYKENSFEFFNESEIRDVIINNKIRLPELPAVALYKILEKDFAKVINQRFPFHITETGDF